MLDIAASVIRRARTQAGLSQRELAHRAATSQPAVARIENGQASPTVATLQRLVAAAGYDLRVELVPTAAPDPVIETYKRGVDRTLLRENLRRSIQDRLQSLLELHELSEELGQAGRAARRRRSG